MSSHLLACSYWDNYRDSNIAIYLHWSHQLVARYQNAKDNKWVFRLLTVATLSWPVRWIASDHELDMLCEQKLNNVKEVIWTASQGIFSSQIMSIGARQYILMTCLGEIPKVSLSVWVCTANLMLICTVKVVLTTEWLSWIFWCHCFPLFFLILK